MPAVADGAGKVTLVAEIIVDGAMTPADGQRPAMRAGLGLGRCGGESGGPKGGNGGDCKDKLTHGCDPVILLAAGWTPCPASSPPWT
jgi:hypothetical protein